MIAHIEWYDQDSLGLLVIHQNVKLNGLGQLKFQGEIRFFCWDSNSLPHNICQYVRDGKMNQNTCLICIVLVFSAYLKYLFVYFFSLYIYLINLEYSQIRVIFIKHQQKTKLPLGILVDLCYWVLRFGELWEALMNPDRAIQYVQLLDANLDFYKIWAIFVINS